MHVEAIATTMEDNSGVIVKVDDKSVGGTWIESNVVAALKQIKG